MDYYVYILFDTKTNDVFYVGKGKGLGSTIMKMTP